MKKGIMVNAICLLVISCFMTTGSAMAVEKTQSRPTGITLYVGGVGPGNYSTIQAAVENASNGDTIFVFDDSSPYTGDVFVDKTLNIFGENKDTTIIDHGCFSIHADHVTVSGFTVCNSLTAITISGPGGTTSYETIQNNKFLNVTYGVNVFYGNTTQVEFTKFGYNLIANNVIRYTKWGGIRIVAGRNNQIIGNDIAPTDDHALIENWGDGIEISGCFNNISYNTVVNSPWDGICSFESYKNTIYRNQISHSSRFGVFLSDASGDQIIQNNFMDNRRDARSILGIPFTLKSHKLPYPTLPVKWDGNYWEKARTLPHPIGGMMFGPLFLTVSVLGDHWQGVINYLRFDWHPAQAPNEITGN